MLPIHTILFPTDFSENAERAFPLACALARDCGARIVVLYVMPLPVGDEQFQARHHPDDYFAGAWEALHQVRAPDSNVRVEHRLEEGDAAKRILELADEVEAGLIVMGTHGRTGFRRLLMGSVAEQVMRAAPCPVLTLKAPLPVGTEQTAEAALAK
ncbi:MAG TPA: universal stress protein [Gemmataceae bacterium]|nr:universal stress protein [Gemmataceae bacterium]